MPQATTTNPQERQTTRQGTYSQRKVLEVIAVGTNPRPRRDRRLKQVPKTARPPRYHDQPLAKPWRTGEGTRNTRDHPTHTHDTNQHKSSRRSTPHPRGRGNPTPPQRPASTPGVEGAGPQRQGGKGTWAPEWYQATRTPTRACRNKRAREREGECAREQECESVRAKARIQGSGK